jgi:hypothetical protein
MKIAQFMELPYFRTIVDIPKTDKLISYSSNIMFIGSCFTEEIGGRLKKYLFNVDVNPFGILYNPLSVAKSLEILLSGKEFTQADLHKRGDVWFSFYHHSKFSSTDLQHTLANINSRLHTARKMLENLDFLFITFGTSWVYRFLSTGEVVSNCHKLPQKLFERQMLESDEIVEVYSELLTELWKRLPQLTVVFTISPIRHWKDGAVGNQYSKSTLIVAVQKLVGRFDKLQYFPSYEIVMDELRDYRFYAKDMIHLSEAAVDYIWLRFGQVYFSESTLEAIKQVEKLLKAMEHRPRFVESEEYKMFVNNTLEKIMLLKKFYPQIRIEELETYFKNLKIKINNGTNSED